MSPWRSRPIALGLIFGAHIVLIYLIERSVLNPGAESSSDDTPPLTVNFIETPRERAPRPLSPELPSPSRRPVPDSATLVPPNVPPISPESDRAAPTMTDWNSEARAAASDTLERERHKSSKHPFAHTPATRDPPDKPGAFGSEQQNHRSGRVEGGTRFWVTDNCYFDVPDGSPPPRMAGEFHLLTRVCKPPPTGGGARMFEDLTPDSLKKLPSH